MTIAARISQSSLASEAWKALAAPRKVGGDRRRHADLGLGLSDRGDRLAQRYARRGVEGDVGGRELADVVDLQRRKLLFERREEPTVGVGVAAGGAQDRYGPAPPADCSNFGSASRITRYWLDWVKMVEMIRWPKAS